MSAVAKKDSVSTAERYRTLFESRARGDDALTTLRRAALNRAISAGFPTQRDEDWKYTNLRRLESKNFSMADKGPATVANSSWIANAGLRVVLVNGHVAIHIDIAGANSRGDVLRRSINTSVNTECQTVAGRIDRVDHPIQLASSKADHVHDRPDDFAREL